MQRGEELPQRRLCMFLHSVTVLVNTLPSFWCHRLEREKSQGGDPSKTSSSLKTAEEVKAHLENQLKQARLAAQQVETLRTAVTRM